MTTTRTTARSIVLALLAVIAGCVFATRSGPGAPVVLLAQSVPFVAHAQWNPPVPTEGVISYTVTLDGGAPITVAPTVDASCSCVQTPISIPAFGSHTVSVSSTNLLLSTDPGSGQQSSAAAVITFSLNRAPSAVTGGKVTK